MGGKIADFLVNGLRAFMGMDPQVDKTAGALEAHLTDAVWKVGGAAWDMGMLLGDSLIFGLVARITEPLFGISAETLAAAWFGPGLFRNFTVAAGARLFDSDTLAAEMVRQFQEAADNPDLPPEVRAAAAEQAEKPALAAGIRSRIELYGSGQPYRETLAGG